MWTRRPSPQRLPSKLQPSLFSTSAVAWTVALMLCLTATLSSALDPPAAELMDAGTYQSVDGTLWSFEKLRIDGEDVTLYRSGDRVLRAEELHAEEASWAPPTLDDALRTTARSASPDEPFELMVWLRERPGPSIARDLRAARMPAIEAMAEEVRAVHRSVRPQDPLEPDAERVFLEQVRAGLAGQLSDEQRAFVTRRGAEVEAQLADLRNEIVSHIRAAVGPVQAELGTTVERLGGSVLASLPGPNALHLRLPAGQLEALAADPQVARIEVSRPVDPELNIQVPSLGADVGFHANGICGDTLWDAGILDTGVQQNHPNLNPARWLSNFGTTDSDGHGTAVAGIVAGDHATFTGLANCLDALLVGSFNSTATVMSHADWMVSTAIDDPEAINLSGGYGTADDFDYSTFDQFWDGLIDDNSVLVCKSTGNGNNADPDSTNNITHPAPSYNLVAVANVNDQNTISRTDDVIWSSSSRGPTLSGRRKPDMAAPGIGTTTTNNNWASAPDFISFGGTSAAAPKCTGATVLLTELRASDLPIANKAVLLNTADTWTDNGTTDATGDDGPVAGSEWNKTYGWGYMDLEEAWFHGNDVFVDTVDDGITPAGRDFNLYLGILSPGEKATLVWNRHVGYNGSNNPVAVESLSDLDLLLYDAISGVVDDSALSGIDNVEQVAASSSSFYVAKVDVFASIDPDVGAQTYALATEEGWTRVNGPAFSFAGTTTGASPGQTFDIGVNITNTGDLNAFDNQVTLGLPPGYVLVGGDNPQEISVISGSASANWTVTAPCSTGLALFNYDLTSNSYAETFEGSTSLFLAPNTVSLADDTPLSSSSVERTYDFPVVSFDWSAVAINPQDVNRNVWTDDDLCVTSPYQTSTFSGGSVRDFTVTNGRVMGSGTHYALVTAGPVAPYSIELDQALDLSAGSSVAESFTTNEVIETFEVFMMGGVEHIVKVTPTSGNLDLSVFGYNADRANGDRANANVRSESAGVGGAEQLLFTPPGTGLYGVVVVNDNAGVGSFELEAAEVIFADGFETGNTSAWSLTVP